MTWRCILPCSMPGINLYGNPLQPYHIPLCRPSSMLTATRTLLTLVQLCQWQSLGSPMRKGPIFVWRVGSYSKGASLRTIPPGMRWSGSLPTGLPTILVRQKREWQLRSRILCPALTKKRIASQSSGHVTWPGLVTPLQKRRVRSSRRRMTCMSRCRRRMSVYPHPSWRIMSVGRWRDEGNQTPKHHLVTRCMVGVRPNQRGSGEDGCRSGRLLWMTRSPLPLTIHSWTLTVPLYAQPHWSRDCLRMSWKFMHQIWNCRPCEQVGQEGCPIVHNFASFQCNIVKP